MTNYSALLKAHAGEDPPTTRARVDRDWMGKGGSDARRWSCTDDFDYAVKHPNNPQTVGGARQLLATEFVVARGGLAMGAPVFPCAVVDIAPELVDGVHYKSRPDLEIQPGRAFGSQIRTQDDLVDADVAPPDWRTSSANRTRAASICVLHALMVLGDSPQFVVRKTSPFEFWSIDHGYFISGGSEWPQDLGDRVDLTDIPTTAFPDFNLTPEEIQLAALPLLQLSDDQLARLIAPLPAEWAPASRRTACLKFVALRRDRVKALVGVDSGDGGS